MKKVLTLSLVIAFCWFNPHVGLACSCRHMDGKTEKEQVDYAREKAAAVFSGVVTEVVVNSQLITFEAKFRVRESWKGVDSEEVSVFGYTECCVCDYTFVVGKSYIVYAYLNTETNRLGTSICLRTKPLADAAEDLRYLGQGKSLE